MCELLVDCYNNLFIINDSGKDMEWTDYIGYDVLGLMTDNCKSFSYSINVLNCKRLSSGNYKVTAKISGTLYPIDYTWSLLLSSNGDIIKKMEQK